MSLVNTSKPTTTLTNTAKVSNSEFWSTIATTWATETRTWGDCISVMDGVSKPITSITNTAKP